MRQLLVPAESEEPDMPEQTASVRPSPYSAGNRPCIVWRAALVADENEGEKQRGLKAGIKHTPGRGHTRKSKPQK